MSDGGWLPELIADSLDRAVWGALQPENVERVRRKNAQKTHFIPLGVRTFSGVVQAMNIRYGNFIQTFISSLVAREVSLALHESSGRRINFVTPVELDAVVDNYITRRKRSSVDNLADDYLAMRREWVEVGNSRKVDAPNDIDLLFRDGSGQLVYIEVKFNDDHDTGKHPDIFRKILKTGFAIEVHEGEPVLPCVYFFNPGERNLVKFLPDEQRLFGRDFFERYLTVDYDEVARALMDVGNDPAVQRRFIDLFHLSVGPIE
jgi:hypothetical protein